MEKQLQDILSNDSDRKAFLAYLKSTGNSDHLAFIQKVNSLRTNARNDAEKLLKKYLNPSGKGVRVLPTAIPSLCIL